MARRHTKVLNKKHLTKRQQIYPRLGTDPESMAKKAYMATRDYQYDFFGLHGFWYFPKKEPLSWLEALHTCYPRDHRPRDKDDRRWVRASG